MVSNSFSAELQQKGFPKQKRPGTKALLASYTRFSHVHLVNYTHVIYNRASLHCFCPTSLGFSTMMPYYSQPAAANYHTGPLHSRRERGYRICDQCGIEETPAVKFRLCGGCVRTGSSSVLLFDIDPDPIDDHPVLCTSASLLSTPPCC